jgi:hypothetical protein
MDKYGARADGVRRKPGGCKSISKGAEHFNSAPLKLDGD